MTIKVTTEDGREIEVYTPEEVEAQKAEVMKIADERKMEAEEARRIADEANEKVAKLQTVIADKNENFKRYKDMTEEEKQKFTAKEIELLKIADEANARATSLEERYNKDTELRINEIKEKAILKLAGSDTELKSKIEENFKLINLEGTDETTINKRAEMAFNMLGLAKANVNPFTQHASGEAPKLGKEFMESARGKELEQAMGEIKFN